MYLLALGLGFLVMKYFGVDPVADWAWWLVLMPFGLAVIWWAWADATGYTKRKAMAREATRKQERINRNNAALKTGTRNK